MLRPTAILCSVFSLGFLVFPVIKSCIVLCVIPESVASLLTVMCRFSHISVSLFIIASEYVVFFA